MSVGGQLRWSNVSIEAIGHVLPEEAIRTASLEASLAPMYRALRLEPGQAESLTGVRERRVWPRGTTMAEVATQAASRALDIAGVAARDVGAVVYAGVSRDNLEPATACAVADALSVSSDAVVFDVSNACLGVLNGMLEVANRIELGQVRVGVVVAAESSRAIVESTITRMNAEPTLAAYRLGLATLTGGSGAVAVVLADLGSSFTQRRLVAAACMSAPQHHRLCRWGPASGLLGEATNVMETDASAVLEHGIALGTSTWHRLLEATGWRATDVDRVICHQVGAAHRSEVLRSIGVDASRDFSTFERLGNIGTVSVPITAALASEAGFVGKGDRVALLGIGSGLNCVMLGVEW